MSYPRKIHTLIVEDEDDQMQFYEAFYEELREEFDLVDPTYALSYDAARTLLDEPRIFHMVIIDLGLPWKSRQPVGDGIEPGIGLLEIAAQRDKYPIPVVLVISGRLNLTQPSELHEQLTRDFWYGRIIRKGDEEEEIKQGLHKAQQYCDVGLHIQDAEGQLCPTLSPREHDLLRRCILKQPECIGVDLGWWGVALGSSSRIGSTDKGLTKMLMGRFILDSGLGVSQPTFFKFEPMGNATHVQRNAAIMNQKLKHVKVCCSLESHTRGVLVTQSVSPGVPISLEKFLARYAAQALPAIPQIALDIAGQLEQLGTSTDNRLPVRKLLWEHHQRENIQNGCEAYLDKGFNRQGAADPLKVFETLKGNRNPLYVQIRSCNHCDLNATNVAVEVKEESVCAYIFDPGAVEKGVNVRDLACLEVTTLLFQTLDPDENLVESCKRLFEDSVLPPADLDFTTGSDKERNTLKLIAEIRNQALRISDEKVYALMVFDNVLMQIGGLAIQPSGNKIDNPATAVQLASFTAQWLTRVAPDIVPTHELL